MRQFITLAVVAASVGCGGRDNAQPRPLASPTAPAPTSFDAATAGAVRGRVVWDGPVPTVERLVAPIPDGSPYRFTEMPNPFAPAVRDGGLGWVLVSLVGVDPGRAKPWPYPAATVEQSGHRLLVRQGDGPPAAVGLVQVGQSVTVVSRDPGPATVRLRGADFVTLPFPGPDMPTVRRFDTPGVVEITSGTMMPWAAADLVVCDHPYHAVTAADGRFALDGVPPGDYRLVCRVRNWRIAGGDRDPETGLVSRLRFSPPVEQAATVRVPTRGNVEHVFTLSESKFR